MTTSVTSVLCRSELGFALPTAAGEVLTVHSLASTLGRSEFLEVAW